MLLLFLRHRGTHKGLLNEMSVGIAGALASSTKHLLMASIIRHFAASQSLYSICFEMDYSKFEERI